MSKEAAYDKALRSVLAQLKKVETFDFGQGGGGDSAHGAAILAQAIEKMAKEAASKKDAKKPEDKKDKKEEKTERKKDK